MREGRAGRLLAGVVFLLAAVWIAALVQFGQPLGPDELEFFRATRWTSLGRLPFRDFWEHHTPLQWLLFAPVARLANGAGTGAVVLMRWAQVPLWVATIAMLIGLARRAGVKACGWGVALALLVLSPTFVQRALEYRVDVLGNFLFVAGVVAWARTRWIVFGALMSLAVLANMRLAPLVIVAGALALFAAVSERRRDGRASAAAAAAFRALRMLAGIAAVVAAFVAYLAATHSIGGFADGVLGYNRLSGHVLAVRTFTDALLLPVWTLDLAGIAYWIAGLAGIVIVLRERAALWHVAVLAVAGVLAIAAMQVHYDYHFQNSWLLLLPLAAVAIERIPRPEWRRLLVAGGVLGFVLGVARVTPAFGAAMRYQNDIMLAADRFTHRGETVFDGGGYALRREPAWRYWFLTTGVRFLAVRGAIERYDAAQMAARPPAAVIADYRLLLYLKLFPRLQEYALQHYVPLYRNLWIPGMTAVADPSPRRVVWVAPRAGVYEIHASELLMQHPWFRNALAYVVVNGPHAAELEIPLDRLRRAPTAALRWSVDGVAQPAGAASLELKKGSRVELVATAPSPVGILLVPRGVRRLCMAPPEEVDF